MSKLESRVRTNLALLTTMSMRAPTFHRILKASLILNKISDTYQRDRIMGASQGLKFKSMSMTAMKTEMILLTCEATTLIEIMTLALIFWQEFPKQT